MENSLSLPASNSSGDSWLSQGKNWAKLIVGVALGLGAVYLFTTYVLPLLLTFVWGTTELAIGSLILAALVYVFVIDRKIYSRLNYLYEAVLELLLGWIIDFDPFVIFKHQIEEKERDREVLKKEGDKVNGKKLELKSQIDTNVNSMKKAQATIQVLKERMDKPGISVEDKEELNLQIQLQVNNFGRFQEFVNTVSPYLEDLTKIGAFANKAYKYSGIAIEDAKQELEMRMATFSAVNSGERAMMSAMKAFRGNSQTNKDAEVALAKLREKVSNKVASIHSCINITNEYMNAIELNNAVQAKEIMAKIDNFNVEAAFSSNVDTKAMLMSSSGKNFGDLKVTEGNKYMDLIK